MYQKTKPKRSKMRRAPLMFGGPTPVNMAPAMAGSMSGYIQVADDGTEIEMPPEYHEGILGKMSRGTALVLVGGAVLAYYFLKKKR